MNRETKVGAAALAIGATVLLAATIAAAHANASTSVTETRLPACVYEDGSGGPEPCYYDASERGNHHGHDVLNVSRRVWFRLDGDRWTRHTDGPPVNCATILTTASYEFPHQAYLAWRICRDNRAHGNQWQFIGHYDGRNGVWAMPGWTTVYVKRGWFETS